jgi:hypothetical protein
VNPQKLDMPEQRAEIIYRTTFRVIAETFDTETPESFPITLELGDRDEHYNADEDAGIHEIHLALWDEKKFAISVMRLVLEHLVDRDCRNVLVSEILTRTNVIAPVEVRPVPSGNSK